MALRASGSFARRQISCAAASTSRCGTTSDLVFAGADAHFLALADQMTDLADQMADAAHLLLLRMSRCLFLADLFDRGESPFDLLVVEVGMQDALWRRWKRRARGKRDEVWRARHAG